MYKRFKFQHKETIVTVLLDDDSYYDIVVEAILTARKAIESMIKRDPLFQVTLEPYDCDGFIVGRMCQASKIAGVGPMASVAGVIAQYAVERAVEEGAKFVVVDNGGDIAMYLDRPIRVGVFTYSQKLCFEIDQKGFYAVCTSSGTIGHSISFGFADACTIFARDACVADAFATALCNEIKEGFGREEIEKTLRLFWEKAKEHILGAVVVKGDVVGFAGNVPKIVKGVVKPDLITKG
ncbi:UPF0280 family protein [Archaeoglobus profundus]|uniref:UPF0280 protein Arcpr_0289 n=1 Tax=Archaeoglobus profundus (strain DSM 5631 / JCM 9629 / NBRC 100127 / Av18) TaxID=572546 RepID=D2RGD4_ARCPA|nr:UPF0280 family protein [Archaeoglobus profundus]ADB57359.1 ApbE family lipoprotein [Archaeoglobus profundus DSM 5631]